MHSTSLLLSVASILSVSLAGSNLDFHAEFNAITGASVAPRTGEYFVRNVGTGQYLYFARDGQVGAYLGKHPVPVDIESQDFLGVTGVIIKGTTDETLKCLSAQWNFDYKLAKRARNEFAVPYECQIGSDGQGTYDDDPNGNDSNKQFWLLNPVEDPLAFISANKDTGITVNLNVGGVTNTKKTTSHAVAFSKPEEAAPSNDDDKSSESTSPAKVAAPTVAAAPVAVAAPVAAVTKQKVDPKNQYTWDCQHDGKWIGEHYNDYIVKLGHVECIAVYKAYEASLAEGVATPESTAAPEPTSSPSSSSSSPATPVAAKQKVDPKNQLTWTCQHDGKWLARHENDYIVKLGHVECIAPLKAYKASLADATPANVKVDAATSKPKVDPKNQLTWDCQHDGKWLARHENDYIVKLGHVECISVLDAYKSSLKNMAKRSHKTLHAELARRALEQRASSQEYFTIHPINHLSDMTTLALGGSSATGFADMPAVLLEIADDTDKSQWWTIERS
ncbi:hypothetical protein RQP46_000802 [Phenoliferia psychrophenolica]